MYKSASIVVQIRKPTQTGVSEAVGGINEIFVYIRSSGMTNFVYHRLYFSTKLFSSMLLNIEEAND